VDQPQLIGVRNLQTLVSDLHGAGVLSATDYQATQAAAYYFATLRQIASLCLQDDDVEPAPAIQQFLLEALNEPDIQRLRDSLATHRQNIEAILTTTLQTL
jgi:hypothetical protein